jgi:hypothetical protein
MGLEMKVKKAVLKELAWKYQGSCKKVKGRIVEESIGLSGYNRCYGSWLLRKYGREVVDEGAEWGASNRHWGVEEGKAEEEESL